MHTTGIQSNQAIAKGDCTLEKHSSSKSKDKMTNLVYYHFTKTNKIRDVDGSH